MLQPGGGAQVWFEDETERERERERERVGVSKRLDNRHIAASLTLTDHVGPSHTHTHTRGFGRLAIMSPLMNTNMTQHMAHYVKT